MTDPSGAPLGRDFRPSRPYDPGRAARFVPTCGRAHATGQPCPEHPDRPSPAVAAYRFGVTLERLAALWESEGHDTDAQHLRDKGEAVAVQLAEMAAAAGPDRAAELLAQVAREVGVQP